ncbi:protein YqbG [Brevibacillus dissolubilis]|uniref:protein YqbG n=1 Tax=Brevibacillus dissolubilis TaxID=1844116 RepID=UPI001116E76D|nr:DUF3199 family protein [Brevibacillus dissolubilis]
MITPQQVMDYSEFDVVKKRAQEKLAHDIIQAKSDIYQYVGHRFSPDQYPTVPEEAILACLRLAEFYALINSDESAVKGYKSERIGDYSYTLNDGNVVHKPMLASLLAGFVKPGGTGGQVRFKMRSV